MFRTSGIFRVSRRQFLSGGALLGSSFILRGTGFADQVENVEDLKPGDYTWHPDRSPDGPITIVVSVPEQLVFVYRNGIRIAVSTCSTGKAGHDTPTGVFTILQKDRDHHSSIYDDASMPNTERLTWSGVALHAGGLPGYPSSHGCVHLPLKFSSLLFSITTVGTAVIIAGQHDEPVDVGDSGMVLSNVAAEEADAAAASAEPHGADAAPPTEEKSISIVISSADKRAIVLENGETVAEGAVTIDAPGTPLGSYTYILSRTASSGGALLWHAIGYNRDSTSGETAEKTLYRIHPDTDVVKAMQARMVQGAILVTTDLPLHPDSRSGKDFVVMDTAPSA